MNIRIKTKEAINNHPLLHFNGSHIKVYDNVGRMYGLWRGIIPCLGEIVTVRTDYRYRENEHINYSFNVMYGGIHRTCITGVVEEIV